MAGAPYLSFYLYQDLDRKNETMKLSEDGLIDNIGSMAEDKVYVYQGILDTITYWGESKYIMKKLIELLGATSFIASVWLALF